MRARIITLAVLLLLAGCSSVPSLLYKIEIQQGNVITQEMVNKLKPGMTRSQVRFALGSPMISDAFHENRWDYLYRFEQRGRLVEQRKLTVFFEDDHLVRVDGSFDTPVAFLQPQPPEAGGPPEPSASLQGADKEKSASSIPAQVPQVPVEASIEMPLEMPISAPISAGTGTIGPVPALPVSPPPSPAAASLSAGSGGVSSSAAPEAPLPEKPGPRQVPSRAMDTGIMDADQPKE